MRERRRFTRIPFQCEATLFLPDGPILVEVLDLSLRGALIQLRQDFYVTMGTPGTLRLSLNGLATSIRMEITVVHHLANFFGLACRDIDLDSMTHLRRLVALNLGGELMAEREFSQLTR